MSETWWALEYADDAPQKAHYQGIIYVFQFASSKEDVVGWKQYAVEIRPLHQDPCPWELQPAPSAVYPGGDAVPDGTNLERLRGGGCKYCPACGRRLGE